MLGISFTELLLEVSELPPQPDKIAIKKLVQQIFLVSWSIWEPLKTTHSDQACSCSILMLTFEVKNHINMWWKSVTDAIAMDKLSSFSRVLLKIYSFAHHLVAKDFQDACLEAVQEILPFDSAMWGSATMSKSGIDIHTLHLFNTSMQMINEYEKVKLSVFKWFETDGLIS